MEEKQFSESLIKAFLKNQRADRRWRNIRFFIGTLIVFLFFLSMLASTGYFIASADSHGKPYVSLVPMNGMILSGREFSAKNMVPLLVEAFEDKKAKGVVLLINSGGGSAVQSSIIYDRILSLKKEHPDKEVIVVGEDMLASGAYLVALAADKIYVNENTVTGSIGVISKGFGFTQAIQKLGIQRRVFTAGENKDRLDPFVPLNEADKQKLQAMLTDVHQYFVGLVKISRAGKLKGDPKELFSGDFWTGKEALKFGLVDGTSNLTAVLKKEFGVNHYRVYQDGSSLFRDIVKNMGVVLDDYLAPRSALTQVY